MLSKKLAQKGKPEIQVRETTGAAPPTTAPEKKKGYTYSSLPSLTGGPKRKIFKQPKRR